MSASPPVASPALRLRVATMLKRRARWRPLEAAFWIAAALSVPFLPGQHLILSEIAILGLFALSLDLVLGYAGIVSLGHAAFFGLGAYVAGLYAKSVTGEPLSGLVVAGLAAGALGFATSFLVLRGADLTRLMVTLGVSLILGEIANRLPGLTGGADGLQGVAIDPILGRFAFDMVGETAHAYSLTVLFVLFLVARRLVNSPVGLSLSAIGQNGIKARQQGVPVGARLVAGYALSAVYAGIAGALLAQTSQFVSLDVFDVHRSADVLIVLVIGGAGWLYGGLVGAVLYRVLQDVLSGFTPQYWGFWLGLALVVLVMVGREGMGGRLRALLRRPAPAGER